MTVAIFLLTASDSFVRGKLDQKNDIELLALFVRFLVSNRRTSRPDQLQLDSSYHDVYITSRRMSLENDSDITHKKDIFKHISYLNILYFFVVL